MTTTTRIGLGLGALVLVTSLGLGAYAAAQDQNTSDPRHPHMAQGGPDGPRGFGGRGGRFGQVGPGPDQGPMAMLPLGRLDLTEAQRAQMNALMESHRAATQPVMERARTAREALHAAVTASAVDEGAIRARSSELASAEADLAVARARLNADILKILTTEQRTELEQARSRRAERMQQMRERWEQRAAQPVR